VDLVDEEDRSRLERCEEGGDIGLALKRRARRLDQGRLHLGGDDVGERGLAEARRPGQEDMVERLPALAGGLDEDRQLIGDLGLVDELREARRTEAAVEVVVPGDRRTGVLDADLGIVDPGRADALAGLDVPRRAHVAAPARSAAWISSSGVSPST
jgi:hypothetical protein